MDSPAASSTAAATVSATPFPADPIPPPSWNVEAPEVAEQETELRVEDYLMDDPDTVPIPMPDAAPVVAEAEEPAKRMQPVAAVTIVAPAPEEAKGRPLTASVITRVSKLSYEYDVAKCTITRIKHDIDSEDMIPTEDEVRLLPHPTLLKGWKVEHRRRTRTLTGHGDKYYTHRLYSGGKLKSQKLVESYIKKLNNIDDSFQVLDACSEKMPRARPDQEPGTSKKKPLTQEVKEHVESFLKLAWQNLMNRDSVKPKSPAVEDAEARDGGSPSDIGDSGDDSRPPGYYGLERRFQPFSA